MAMAEGEGEGGGGPVTRQSIDDLTTAVELLSTRVSRSRKWTVILGAVTVLSVVLTLAVGGLALWFADETRSTDEALEEMGRVMFLTSCEAQNEGRRITRENNLSDAETLIFITGVEATDPEIADEYRRLTAERNARIVDRNCLAELADATLPLE